METKKSSVLKALEANISIVIAEKFDPQKYFKDRDGLYVWSSFSERVLSKAKTVKADSTFDVASFNLTKAANDEAIEESLPEKHLFSESDVCAIISYLIDKQPTGKKGILQNNGYGNLFYTKAFVVFVFWHGVGWRVSAWPRDDDGWRGDRRVFSPATDIS